MVVRIAHIAALGAAHDAEHVVSFDRESMRDGPRCWNRLQGLNSCCLGPLDSGNLEGYRKVSRIRYALVDCLHGKVFVVLFVGAADAAAAGCLLGPPGYLVKPRERYNDDTKELKLVLVIRRMLVGFVNAGGASRSRQEWPVYGPQWFVVWCERRKLRYLLFLDCLESRRYWLNW